MTLWTPQQTDVKDWTPRGSGILLPPAKVRYGRPVGVDLFSGAGGFSTGFHAAGFHVVAALEYDFDSAITYTHNLGEYPMEFHFDTDERRDAFNKHLEKALVRRSKDKALVEAVGLRTGDGWISGQENKDGCRHFWVADARNVSGREILDAICLEPGEVDVIFGGPPCQGFSIAGKRNVMDDRNSLVFEFARLVLEIRPKAFVMENVMGITTMLTSAGVPVLDQFCRILDDGGFGKFEALKRGLLASSGAGMALTSKKRGGSKQGQPAPLMEDDPDDDGDHDVFTEAMQGALFA